MRTLKGNHIVFTEEELAKHNSDLISQALESSNAAWIKRIEMMHLLTVADVADVLKRDVQTVRKWARRGEHPRYGNMGWFIDENKWRISQYDFNQFLEALKKGFE